MRPLPEASSNVSGWLRERQPAEWPADNASPDSIPRLSIVTPSFNTARFIEEAIRSALLQGYPNLEFIIIDGGSSDGTADIIRKYEPWLAYWESQPDRGQSHALNKGWARATGQWMGWLNADDVYTPGAFAKAAPFFAPSKNTDLVYGDVQYINADGTARATFRGAAYTLKDVIARGLIHTPSVFWRRELNNKAGPLDESLRYTMDNDFWMRACPFARCVYLPETLSAFRRHEGSKTVNAEEGLARESLAVARRYLDAPAYAGLFTDAEKKRIPAQNLWSAAMLALRRGDEQTARREFGEAISQFGVMGDADSIALRTVKELLESRPLPMDEIRRALSVMPLAPGQRKAFESAVWRKYWELKFYGSYAEGDARGALNSALPLAARHPARLADKGFLSIVWKSLRQSAFAGGWQRSA